MVSITLLAALFKTAFINGWIVRRVLCGYNKPDMVEILRNKSFATRFQILIEIATHGPTIQQRAIAQELSITPQAVSDYISQLEGESMITYLGRSRYQITREGVNWVLKNVREVKAYFDGIDSVINGIVISPAIAEKDIKQGEQVGLKMVNGLLYATADCQTKSTGIAEADAKAGEDVGVRDIQGLIEFSYGLVAVLVVPGIAKGGSRHIDLELLKTRLKGVSHVGAIGLESVAALHRAGIEPDYLYDVSGVVIDAALHGLSSAVVCTEEDVYALVSSLKDRNIEYSLISL
nr:winged helix-turn-helix transcriptional regulator [Dehalococcoides mccartyi]